MPRPSKRALRFVHALLPDGVARRESDVFGIMREGRPATLPEAEVREMLSAGVLHGGPDYCAPNRETAQWLKRQLVAEDHFAAQHRLEGQSPEGLALNLAESPLARLAVAATGEVAPFLARHQVEAGERVRKLFERANLRPRLTMNYSAAQLAGKGQGRAAEVSELASEARRKLDELYAALPRDCAEVVLDVCGLLKGLQLIETERGWPRRSAKLVLRIGLDRVAELWGIGSVAIGRDVGRRQSFMDGDRVRMFD